MAHHSINRHRHKCFIIGMLVALMMSSFFIMALLYKTNGMVRLSVVNDLSTDVNYRDESIHDENEKKLKTALASAGLLNKTGEAQVLAILDWVMSLTDKVESNPNRSGWELLQSVKQGRGLSCWTISQLYLDALKAAHISARRVVMKQSMFFNLYNTHTAVEVWVNGRWRFYDPTFHIVFKDSSGQLVGIYDLQQWYLHGTGRPISMEFLGEVNYPVRVETYYMNYFDLLNYVFIERRNPSKLKALIINEFPAVWLYQKDSQLNSSAIIVYTALYFVVFKIIPLLLLLILGYLMCPVHSSFVKNQLRGFN